jgi:hypothetical protein
MQRLKPQNPQAYLDRALVLTARARVRHQPRQNIDQLLP